MEDYHSFEPILNQVLAILISIAIIAIPILILL